MTNPQTEAAIKNQAEYLGENTALTEREAEAYLWRYVTESSVTQRELAGWMGVDDSTFSNYLTNATEKIDSEESTFGALRTLLSITKVGGLGKTKQVIASKMLSSNNKTLALIERDEFDADSRITSKYRLHIIYRDNAGEHLTSDAPDDIIMNDKWTLFTVKGDSEEHLVRSTVYYLETIVALSEAEKFNLLRFLGNSGFNIEEYKEESLEKAIDSLKHK